MSTKEQVAVVILEILEIGLLRVRCAAESENSASCWNESNHLHNLPALVRLLKRELLSYYLDIEVPSFLLHSSGNTQAFEQSWQKLRELRDRWDQEEAGR
jgi:hypothetical protein